MFRTLTLKREYGLWAAALVGLALALAWVSSAFTSVTGWPSFLAALVMGAAFLGGGLWALRGERLPRWVLALTLGAALLRLGAGVLWDVGLPLWGYDTAVQQAGYVMEDAFNRDRVAWSLAQSDEPLWIAFSASEVPQYRNADQYGGMLFLSAAIYRYLGGEIHHSLMMVVITSAFSALAVALTWAATRRLFSTGAARWAAWGMALYPEAVLLGSSQMREAFMMTLAAAAFYGLARYYHDRERTARGLTWVLGAILLSLPLSPPLAGILIGMLVLVAAGMGGWQWARNWRLWAVLGGLTALVLAGMWIGWEQIAPRISAAQFDNPFQAVYAWLRHSARWQAHVTKASSGSVQKIFRSTPDWFNAPFLIAYGVVRPLLPPALLHPTAPLWRGIAIWRALGWTILLPVLVYAPLRALRSPDRRRLTIGISLAVWAGILIASFWGGGDMWDNPRYRVSFVTFSMALMGWGIAEARRAPDPVVRWAFAGVVSALVWFVPWYIDRYTYIFEGWPVQDVFKLAGLSLATTGLFIVWDWSKQPVD